MMKSLSMHTLAFAAMMTLCGGVLAQKPLYPDTNTQGQLRVDEVMHLVDGNYVDGPDLDRLSEVAIVAMLKDLDPHSYYISAEDVKRANEGLEGEFEGVGISYQIIDDTIVVASVVDGGPSEGSGIMMGDRIVGIDGVPSTGDSVNNKFVVDRLRGRKGTRVTLDVLRRGTPLSFRIKRGAVPIPSIDTYFMANDTIGYIRLIRFARNSDKEFRKAVGVLRKQGMQALILDLRGNTGGYLDIAYRMSNEFLQRGELVVYTEGRTQPRRDYKATGHGSFRKGRLAVLVDESSASASEIVSGAVQDWDRGTLVGRRSYGKGLVQRIFSLEDGSQIRLTTARYYTPSGRCIQRPYDEGTDAYRRDLDRRLGHGELLSADSVHFPDSLRYTTHAGRTVYGGGGIMPDVFVPIDTMRMTDYYIKLNNKRIIGNFALQWAVENKDREECRDYLSFLAAYSSFGLDSLLEEHAKGRGVERDLEQEAKDTARTEHSDNYLHLLLKAQIARNLFGSEYYYMVMCVNDDPYLKALEILKQQN